MLGTAFLLGVLLARQADGLQSVRRLELGKEQSSSLAGPAREGVDAPCERFELELQSRSRITLRVRSLDFQPTLVLRELPSGKTLAKGKCLIVCDAWLATTAELQGRLEVDVSAEDMRGGTFQLLATAGGLRPPENIGQEGLRVCEQIARAAQERGEPERAADFWLQAGEWASSIPDRAALGAALDHCKGPDDAPPATPIERGARLLLALADTESKRDSQSLGALAGMAEAIDSDAPALPAGKCRERAYRRMALLHDRLGDLRHKLETAAKALPDYRLAAQAADESGLAIMKLQTCSKLSLVCEEAGESDAADHALAKCNQAALSDAGRSVALHSLARVLALRGESARAQVVAREALKLRADPSLRAEELGTLAITCIDLGQYEEAAALLDEVEQLVQDGRFVELEEELHRTRAVLAFRLGDLSGARRELDEVLRRLAAAGSVSGVAETWIDLAAVLDLEGRSEEAQARAKEAIARARELHVPRIEAQAQLALGRIHERRKEAGLAFEAYKAGARLAEYVGDEALGAQAACGLGCAAWLGGKLEEARTYSVDAARRLESIGWVEEALEAHDTLAKLALSSGDAAALRGELDAAAGLLGRFERQGLDPWQRAGQRARFAEWGAFEQALVGMELGRVRAAEEEEAAILRRGWELASRWKGRELLGELGQRIPPEDLGGALDAAARGTWLPPRTALLEYVESPERMFVYVVQRGSIRRVDLGERDRIREEARGFARDMAVSSSDPRALAGQAHLLWKRLLAPLLPALEGSVDTLVVVPAPPLAAVPFDALVSDPNPDGESPEAVRCVIDDFLVCYAPATTLLPVLRQRPPRAEDKPRFLIVADPLYPGEEPQPVPELASRQRTEPLRRLLESREEAFAMADLLLATHPDESREFASKLLAGKLERSFRMTSKCFDLFLGSTATAEVLRVPLTDYSDLHFAMHARLDPDDPRRSALILSGGAAEPGFFELEEAWNMRLDANLVVLSACATAGGVVKAGEGVQSLACAFLHAQARAVVASLWPVEDRDAGAILRDFQRRRLENPQLQPARALRSARLEFRKGEMRSSGVNGENVQRRWEPWKWASWVYIGAPPPSD